ncbi:1-phosphatidylinositol 4,5-bisphosphate phosphodiesterase delta-1, variant 2 [Entomophthora muscae]|uniref:1-phosphatidylinositol 4,5-bisphosphate phosphodiesterase delta-1, variant 2 n=1 Tax=Entomophthora muscae TaxID=34485 RepID=A0ACC2T804_9FUNG|nr:1-phosphatidylinositol 4,5-bisphosphate phosphodiesterase delta-1, variant 2 [Entomophthora muscae]
MSSSSAQDTCALPVAMTLPSCVLMGTEFTKINNSNKGSKIRIIKYDPVLQRLTWDSRKLGVIQLEWISCIKAANSIQDFPSTAQETIPNRLVIYYSHKGIERRLNLIAPTKSIAQEWYNYLSEKMVNSEHFSTKTLNNFCNAFDKHLESWLRQHWAVVDKNKDGKITLKEFKTFLNLINYECTDSELKSLFKNIDNQASNYLNFETTKNLYYFLQSRPEVHTLYTSIISQSKSTSLSEEDFYNFLRIQQKENHSPEMLKSIFHRYSQGNPLGLSEQQFLYYLCSEDNSALRSIEELPKHDMDYPLNDYWINSSHNTYLTGDQIKSSSSTSMYKDALLKGCRCVELDCWDGPKGEPIIYHGYTLTSKILFKDVIETIHDHAFTASPYPVILSLEVHCSLAQQDMIATHLKSILGDSLVTSRLEDPSIEPQNLRLPSPNQLLRKIIIKGKSLELKGSSQSGSDSPKKTESPGIRPPMVDGYFTGNEPLLPKDESESPTKAEKKTKVKVSKLLSDLTPYCQAKKFKDFQHSLENFQYFQMSSFSEASLLESFNKGSLKPRILDFLRHNQRFLSRVYPDGLRIDSSNFNPLPFWLAGFQLVALNYQKFGKSLISSTHQNY